MTPRRLRTHERSTGTKKDTGLLPAFFLEKRSASVLYDSAYVKPDVVWPKEHGQHAFPEGKMQEADGEKPPGEPGETRERMVFDLYLFHVTNRSLFPLLRLFRRKHRFLYL